MNNPEGLEKTVPQNSSWESDPIFALDIGTRSIIGIVGIQEGDLFRILDVERQEHTKRAMIDGQIEDIDQTAKIAGMVKSRLEEKMGFPLKDVFVAAAGRALRTQKASFELQLDPKEPIREQKVLELELGAIQEARDAIKEEEGRNSLYCVGHSVIRYYLDDYPLSTLLSHKGSVAKVEIIATFLPNEVVESLYAAMEKTGLSVASVTLEPIAAMNAIIPSELRMLNLVLVDVGAGTSDIAISNNGSVSAYTMATIAGDEITETLVKEFLVDFDTAEKIKISLSENVGSIEYQDILGFNYTLTRDEVMEKIKPAVENLSSVISERVMEMNEKAPAAVFLVGGGSQIPGLCDGVAEKLGVAENKVAVGGSNYMKRLVVADMDIKGPEYATPVGIALTAVISRSRESFVVTINGQKKHVYKAGTLSVVDVLMMSGYKQNQIMGRSGQSVTFEMNQQKKVVRGGHPVPATIEVNGKSASIATPVQSGDVITFEPAVQGLDASPTIQDVVEYWEQFDVYLNDAKIPVGTTAFINGVPVGKNQVVKNLDLVEIHEVNTLSDLCREAKLDLEKYRFLVNGTEQQGGYMLEEEDDIRYFSIADEDRKKVEEETSELDQEDQDTQDEDQEQEDLEETETSEVVEEIDSSEQNAEESNPDEEQEETQKEPQSEREQEESPKEPQSKREQEESQKESQSKREQEEKPKKVLKTPAPPKHPFQAKKKEPANADSQDETDTNSIGLVGSSIQRVLHIRLNDRPVELYPKEDGTPYLFLDMLNFVDIDPSKPQGNIVLKIDGHNASYLDAILDGSVIEIYWDKFGLQ